MRVALCSQPSEVDRGFGRFHPNGPETRIFDDSQSVCVLFGNHCIGQDFRVALQHQIDIDQGATEEQIADWPADEVECLIFSRRDPRDPRQESGGRIGNGLQQLVEAQRFLHRREPAPRGCRDSTVSRSFERLTCV